MRSSRLLLTVLCVLSAQALQGTVFARIPAPGGRADLVLVVAVGFALAEGPLAGAAVGFSAGLLSDLLSDHPLGLYALVLCVVGYLCGLVGHDTERSTLRPLLVVGSATVGAALLMAGISWLLGDPRVTWFALVRHLPATVLYDVILAPFVVPGIVALSRRLDPVER